MGLKTTGSERCKVKCMTSKKILIEKIGIQMPIKFLTLCALVNPGNRNIRRAHHKKK